MGGIRLAMPLIRFQAENFIMEGSGATSQKRLIDLSALLSSHYGRLIRQGQIFMIRGVHARLRNPGGVVQDEGMALSGQLEFFQPTSNRKRAWTSAFKSVQNLRKLLGVKQDNYDFRVGLNEDYGTVPFNAWINEEQDPLSLARTDDSMLNNVHHMGIFNVYNEGKTGSRFLTIDEPADSTNGFGTPFMTAGLTDEDIDFQTDEDHYFVEGWAHESTESLPFQLQFTSIIGSSGLTGIDGDAFAVTPSLHIDLQSPIPVMCGLLGVHIDTTLVDDHENPLNMETTLELTLDVERWSPIL